jgi:hypothetical protein
VRKRKRRPARPFLIGAGLVLALAAVAFAWQWYLHRSIPWNASALTGSFEGGGYALGNTSLAAMGQPAVSLVLRFSVSNGTGADVRIKEGTEVLTRLAGTNELRPMYGASIHQDVVVPAGRRAVVEVLTLDRCVEDKGDWSACMKKDFSEARSLVFFLPESEYQVELPLR